MDFTPALICLVGALVLMALVVIPMCIYELRRNAREQRQIAVLKQIMHKLGYADADGNPIVPTVPRHGRCILIPVVKIEANNGAEEE